MKMPVYKNNNKRRTLEKFEPRYLESETLTCAYPTLFCLTTRKALPQGLVQLFIWRPRESTRPFVHHHTQSTKIAYLSTLRVCTWSKIIAWGDAHIARKRETDNYLVTSDWKRSTDCCRLLLLHFQWTLHNPTTNSVADFLWIPWIVSWGQYSILLWYLLWNNL